MRRTLGLPALARFKRPLNERERAQLTELLGKLQRHLT